MKYIYIIFALLMPCLAKAQNNQYIIRGKVDDGSTGYIYLIKPFYGKSGKELDSGLIGNNGRFEIKGTVSERAVTVLYYGNGKQQKVCSAFYLEPGNININIKKESRYAELSGTPLNNDFNDYYSMISPVLDSINRVKPLKNRPFPYDQFSKEITPEKLHILRKFIKIHPNSLVSVYQLNIYSRSLSELANADSLYKRLSTAVKKTREGADLGTRIKSMLSVKVGGPAPQFSLPDTSGKMVNLSDFKGKYVLIDFWASWCGPCKAENPNLVRLYSLYKTKGFDIMGVSLDSKPTKKAWLDNINDGHLSWTQVSDLRYWNSKVAVLYNVNSVPTNFLLDPQGKIIAKNLRGKDLEDKLKELFN